MILTVSHRYAAVGITRDEKRRAEEARGDRAGPVQVFDCRHHVPGVQRFLVDRLRFHRISPYQPISRRSLAHSRT